jgi:MoaA/NifB/PqqE/SkfB family radical SAM enzyme
MIHREKIKKTVIITGYSCNNNCVFCLNKYKRGKYKDKDFKEIVKAIREAKYSKTDIIEFIGGEPTLRKDIVTLIRYASKLGIKVSMATNGRRLSYENFAQSLCQAGIYELIFSLHGHTSVVHDSLTQVSGSYDELIKGLENVKKFKKVRVSINHTIVKQNYRYLPQFARFIKKFNPVSAEFIFVDPTYGAANTNFSFLVPKISNAAPYMRKCIKIGKGRSSWRLRYVPLCYFADMLDNISEINEKKVFFVRHIAPDFVNNNVILSRINNSRIKSKNCKNCFLNDLCEGIWQKYAQVYGKKELIAVKNKKSLVFK